jgi:putative glutamine amidotransferase
MAEDGPLARLLGGTDAPINSHHHQGLDRVAEGLVEIAWAEDGVLEGVYAPDHTWVLGVQWHPEAMAPVDARQLAIFEHFVAAAEAYATRPAVDLARSA